jgi:hypothetical protein
MSADIINKYPIFIVGLPRSGSTLWLNILAQNPKIFRIGEIHFLNPWRKDFRYFIRKQVGDLSYKKNIEKMIELMFSRKWIPGITGPFWYYDIGKVNDCRLKKILCRKIQESDKSLGSIFRILIEEITRFSNYTRCCVKFPVYVNYIPQLLQWYPECKIIHIIRDPRAVAMSKTNDPGGTAKRIAKYPYLRFIIRKVMIFFVIFQYIWTSKLHCKYKNFKNYALFRYEDLLANPEVVVKQLCEFTDVEFVPEMLEPKEGQKSSITGEKQKGFNKKAASHWKNIITPLEEKIITFLTKSSMKRFGYDYKNHPVFLDK